MPDAAYDVAIVGFGPVGTALATLLARRGHRVIAYDRDIDVHPLPRAAHIDDEILRILQAMGCADDCVGEMCENLGMDFLNADRELLLRFESPGEGPSGWPASLFIHQPTFDRRLRAAAVDAGVDVRLGQEVTTLDELDAQWIVGCDGARSMVRREMGAELDDLGFEESWLVVDLLVPDDHAQLPDRALQVCDPSRPHTLVPMPGSRFRFEFMLLPGEDPTDIQRSERVDELLSSWIDPELVEVERGAVYVFHGLIAKQWRKGRMLLAGDAAHQMPPFLGQGMCSGLRDAANLAWKLDLVLRGHASNALLDTYQTEREPHVRVIVEAAVSFGRMICTLDHDEAAARDAALLEHGPQTRRESPAMPGTLMPQGRARADGRVGRFDDVVGNGWRLIADTTGPPDLGSAQAWFETIGGRTLVIDADFDDIDGTYRAFLRQRDARAVLQRPDFGVFGTGEAETLLKELRDHLDT
jgi:3-(3-hydroxy-phenyl)propionate hydroxylase